LWIFAGVCNHLHNKHGHVFTSLLQMNTADGGISLRHRSRTITCIVRTKHSRLSIRLNSNVWKYNLTLELLFDWQVTTQEQYVLHVVETNDSPLTATAHDWNRCRFKLLRCWTEISTSDFWNYGKMRVIVEKGRTVLQLPLVTTFPILDWSRSDKGYGTWDNVWR
jgi:hypothetical protein